MPPRRGPDQPSAAGLAHTVAANEGVGQEAIALPVDVSDGDAVTAAVAELGPLRYAVDCVGIDDQGPGESMPDGQCAW